MSATMELTVWLMSISIGSGCGGGDSDDVGDADDSGDGAEQTEVIIKTFPLGRSPDGPTENVTLLAFQDGDGEWVALDGVDGVYHANTTGQRYGVAVGCVEDSDSRLHLFYQTVSDATEVRTVGCRDDAELVGLHRAARRGRDEACRGLAADASPHFPEEDRSVGERLALPELLGSGDRRGHRVEKWRRVAG
jgi:hypothetical protein